GGGLGVLTSDRSVGETRGICARAYLISEGKVLTDGQPDEIGGDPAGRRVYLGEHFRMYPSRARAASPLPPRENPCPRPPWEDACACPGATCFTRQSLYTSTERRRFPRRRKASFHPFYRRPFYKIPRAIRAPISLFQGRRAHYVPEHLRSPPRRHPGHPGICHE